MMHSKRLAEMVAIYESGKPVTFDATEVQFQQTLQLTRIANALEALVSMADAQLAARYAPPAPPAPPAQESTQQHPETQR